MRYYKIYKKIKNNIIKYEPFILTTLGSLFLIFSVFTFALGFHNFDLAQNFEEIELMLNVTLLETNMQGDIVNLDDLYRQGVYQIFTGFFFSIWSMFLLTIGIMIYEKRIGNIK